MISTYNRYQEVYDLCHALRPAHPGSLELVQQQARSCRHLGRLEEALQLYHRGRVRAPRHQRQGFRDGVR